MDGAASGTGRRPPSELLDSVLVDLVQQRLPIQYVHSVLAAHPQIAPWPDEQNQTRLLTLQQIEAFPWNTEQLGNTGFLEQLVPAMRALGPPALVRLVFWYE